MLRPQLVGEQLVLRPEPHARGQPQRHHPPAAVFRVIGEEEDAALAEQQQDCAKLVAVQSERVPHEGQQLLAQLTR